MRLTPKRVRAMLAAATPGPWTWRSDAADGCHVVEDPRARYDETERLAETFCDSTADIVLMAAAPDLAADVLTLHATLATERERAEVAERGLSALWSLLEVEGCDCPCCHGDDDHDEECSRCLGCRIEHAVKAALAGCP